MSEAHDNWLRVLGVDFRRLQQSLADTALRPAIGAADTGQPVTGNTTPPVKSVDGDEGETAELLSTGMLPLLRLAMKGQRMHALVASTGKKAALLLSRKPIPPARRKLLAERLGASGGVKYFAGSCALDEETKATTFLLPAEVQGLAKKLKSALLEQTGLKVNKISCRGVDGSADHDDEEAIGEGEPSFMLAPTDAESPVEAAPVPLLEKARFGTAMDPTRLRASAPGGGDGGTLQATVKGRRIPYSIPVTRTMDNLEFSIHVDMILGMSRDEAVEANKDPKHRVTPLTFVVTAAHVRQRSVVVGILHSGLAPVSGEEVKKADGTFKEYGSARQDEINDRTNEEFWRRTGLPWGTKLDPKDPNFKSMAQAWKELRSDVVKEQELYDRIPPESKQFLKFAPGGVSLTEENIDKIIAIAQKVRGLTPTEMGEYWAATEGRTDDVDRFAASVDAYLEKVEKRRAAAENLDQAHNKLVGKDELLQLYRLSRQPPLPTVIEHGIVNRAAVEHNRRIEEARRALGPLLKRWGYDDTKAFEADVEGYENAFRDQAITTADMAMDRREHELWRFEAEVLTADSVEAMFATLKEANAKGDELILEQDPGLARLIELLKQEDPDFELEDVTDMLSKANSANALKRSLTRALEERREGIAETRRLLKEEPDKVWRFDNALAYGKARSDAEEGSIQDQIVDDKIKAEASKELGKKILVGVVAIGAGLLTLGEGTVAVLGGAAALGIGAADAWDTYVSYVEEDAANKAGLSSSDPSFAWVVVALATLPLDVLALGSAIKAAKSAPHIAKILEAGTDTGDAVRAFNTAGEAIETADDAARALAKLEQELATAHTEVRAAIMRAARAEAEAKAAWAAARKARAGRAMVYIDPIVSPLADLVIAFAYPVAMSIRKGLTKFDAFLKSSFARTLIKDVGALSPEAMIKLEKAFAEAKAGWEVAAKRAIDLGLTDVELELAMRVWAGKPDLDAARFVTEILEPMAQARNTVPEFAKVMTRTETLPGGVASLEEALVKAAGDPEYATQLRPYLKDLRKEIGSIDPAVRNALPEASEAALASISRQAGEALDAMPTVLGAPPVKPTGHAGGKPTGSRTPVRTKDDAATQRSLARENESADTLATQQYKVEQNPPAKPNGKKPDYLIEGEYFDNYAPGKGKSPRGIWTEIEGKVKTGQADRIVLNLDDWDGTIEDLMKQFDDWPIKGLMEVKIVRGGTVSQL